MIERAIVPKLDAVGPGLLAQGLPVPILGDETRRGMETFGLSAHSQLERVATLGEERAHQVPMSALKSQIGHPQGACGAAGVAATIIAMQTGRLPPTINLDTPDPLCDLDYVPQPGRAARIEHAVANCIAFGSKNSALVLRRAG